MMMIRFPVLAVLTEQFSPLGGDPYIVAVHGMHVVELANKGRSVYPYLRVAFCDRASPRGPVCRLLAVLSTKGATVLPDTSTS